MKIAKRPSVILVVGTILLLLMVLFPPWRDASQPPPGKTDWVGYGFLWMPPKEYDPGLGVRIHFPVLIIQLVLTCTAVVGMYLSVRGRCFKRTASGSGEA